MTQETRDLTMHQILGLIQVMYATNDSIIIIIKLH